MLPDWVSNPGPLTYELGALPIALRGPAPVMNSADKHSDLCLHCSLMLHTIQTYFTIVQLI